METILFGLLFSAGVLRIILTLFGKLKPRKRRGSGIHGSEDEQDGELAADSASAEFEARLAELVPETGARRLRASRIRISLSPLAMVQLFAAVLGLLFGWWATHLVGMAALLGGLGALIPPFMAAPRRRRLQTRGALAWQLWSRQLAELARAGASLTEALRGSVEHAPAEVADTVEQIAMAAEMHGLEVALDQLADSGEVWEPEVAAGLSMAATSGGSVADPLLDLCSRIGDVVDLHRSKTEAVVALWTQTIALLVLAAGVVGMMYNNNPSYFEPYRTSTGQMVLVLIAGVLLLSVGFLVYHSVVREERSVLVLARGRQRTKTPL